MNVTVVCEECGNAEVARAESDDLRILCAMLIASHAQRPHSSSHQLKALANGEILNKGDRTLLIECLHPQCANNPNRRYEVATPMDLVAVHAIQMHSAHEGHPIKITLDGKVIHAGI